MGHQKIQVIKDRHFIVYPVIKRIFDFVLSLLSLVILSPVFAIIAILIKKEDGGPIFYNQLRVGKDERRFKMYKFRSMVVDADARKQELMAKNEIVGAMFKIKDDPRVTKVGRTIRRFSLDELPQLLNVIGGKMSLVGPRPPLIEEVAKYTPYDKQRLLVTPGCTGLWQATKRNEASFDEMVHLDITYINNRSLWFDLKIIFMTIKVMLHPNGAY
ncbi:MAG: sugar transferase [Lactobacillus sp.]|nr:sugar transferase [Lactobacillus sp.]MDN6052161.1 sugar transferase [Lactobacillus sp.]